MFTTDERLNKVESERTEMKMLLIRVADGIFGLQQEVRGLSERMDVSFSKVHSRMDQFERAEAERHKGVIGFLSKHKDST